MPIPAQDLLSCLKQVAEQFHQTYTEESLISGLPVKGKQLSAQSFVLGAERLQLNAQIIPLTLFEIPPAILPIIALSDDTHGFVITKLTQDGFFEITNFDGKVFLLSSSDLATQYNGKIIAIKRVSKISRAIENTLKLKQKAHGWFWRVLADYIPIYSEIFIASGIINLLALASPLFVMNVYDRVVPNDATDTLWMLAIGVFIAFSFDFVLRLLRTHFIDHAARNIDTRLSAKMFAHLMDLKSDTRPGSVGHLVNTVQAFEAFREFITSASVTALVDLPFVFLFVMLIAILGGSLALIPLIMIPLVLFISYSLQKPLITLVQKSYQAASVKQTALLESLISADAIKSLNAQNVMQSKWEDVISYGANIGLRLRFLSSLATNVSLYSQFLGSTLIIILGVYKISQGELSLGALIACTILTGRALAPIVQAAGLLMRYYQSISGIEGLNKIMLLPIERSEEKQFIHPPILKGKIGVHHVSYTYQANTEPALHDLNFTINPGEHVAIVGRIGSGKSTLLKLLASLSNPTQGTILIDDLDLQQYDPADLRKQIGYVPQEIYLFNGSIKENIRLANPHATDEQFIAALQFSGLDKLLVHQPNGLDFIVGERGLNLSGGQRQAIAIAQALLNKPNILLLDEPTKSMDDMSEIHILNALKNYYTNKTTVFITHKINLINLAERIIVIDHGLILADGPRDTVLSALNKGHVKAKNS